MLVGVVVGLGQGYVISRLGINSMVLTIGSSILIGGIAWLAAGGQPVVLTDFTSSDFLLTRWWIFSPASLTGILVLSLIGVFLARLRLGREVYAVGGARQEADRSRCPDTKDHDGGLRDFRWLRRIGGRAGQHRAPRRRRTLLVAAPDGRGGMSNWRH